MLDEHRHAPPRKVSRLKQLNKSNRRARRHLLRGAVPAEKQVTRVENHPIFKVKKVRSIEDLELDAT